MAGTVATRERDGVKERRCGCPLHTGATWLPLTAAHFYPRAGGFGWWCIQCYRAYSREKWRAAHPESRPRVVCGPVETPPGVLQLDAVTSGWGRG